MNSDINYKGSFTSIKKVWETYPYGGVEGDYLLINNKKYRWNKYVGKWENAEVVTDTPARDMVDFDADVNMQNNLTVAGVLRAKKFVVDNLPTGIDDVEITESAVSGGTNVITFTYTNGESQTFNIKNGTAGKTQAAFIIVASATDKSGWDTGKCYLALTETEGEFDVYSYENSTWSKVDTIEIDLDYDIDNTLSTSSEKPVQNKVITADLNRVHDYVGGDVRTLAVGSTYAVGEAVKTSDNTMVRMTKEIKAMNTTDAVATGDLKAANNKTYKALYPISAYSSSGDYSTHPYALGRPTIYTITISVSGFEESGNVSLTIGGTSSGDIAVNTESTAASIASDIVTAIGSISGWRLTNNNDGTITLDCLTGGANTITITSSVGSTGVTINTATTATGAATTSKYANGAWSAASESTMYADTSLYQEVAIATLISTYTTQNSVTQDINSACSVIDRKTYYYYDELDIDTSPMTKSSMSLGTSKAWLNRNSSSHVVIPCLAGDVFNIKVSYSAGTGGFRGWLTSAYVPPTVDYSRTPYVSGQDRVWQYTSAGEQTITAPVGAAYLCLCTRDGSGQNCTWVGKRVRSTTMQEKINNDLVPAITTNTQDIAALKVKPSFVPSSYLPIKETHERLMNVSGTQGGALYQDTFVFFYGVGGNRIRIYDLNAKRLIQTIMLPEFSNTRTHGNTLSFGSAFYDANDDFPLLYICSGYTDTTSVSTSEVYVIRIAGESGSYTVSLVQTITLDFGITNNWTEFVVDPILNRAWIKGSGIASYICVALPSTSSSTATIGTSTTIIDKFNVPAFLLGTTSSSSGQGWYFYHNRIYYVSGIPQISGQGEYSTYICVVNTLTHVIEAVLPLVNFGLTNGTSYNYEPECCFIWNDDLYVVFPSFIEKVVTLNTSSSGGFNFINVKFNGKKCAIVGDSISSYTGTSPSGYANYYPSGNVNDLSLMWWSIVCNTLGMTPINCSWSGSRVTGAPKGSSASPACSDMRISDMGRSGAPDIIIFFIGCNDWGNEVGIGTWSVDSAIIDDSSYTPSQSVSTFREAFSLMLNKTQKTYPNAKVYCCTILDDAKRDHAAGYPSTNDNGVSTYTWNQSIKQIADAMGISVIDIHSCGLNYANIANYVVDEGLHPNKDGHALIAEKVISQLISE